MKKQINIKKRNRFITKYDELLNYSDKIYFLILFLRRKGRRLFVCCVCGYPAFRQHVKHRTWIHIILDHNPTEGDADQVTGFPLGDRSSGAVTTQQLII